MTALQPTDRFAPRARHALPATSRYPVGSLGWHRDQEHEAAKARDAMPFQDYFSGRLQVWSDARIMAQISCSPAFIAERLQGRCDRLGENLMYETSAYQDGYRDAAAMIATALDQPN